MRKANWLMKSEPVSSDSLGQLEISGHDGHSLGVDGAQVGVFEQGDQVGFGGFLEGQHSWWLESQFLFPFVGDFSDHSLEGKFSDKEISWFLIFSDFPKSNCSGFESVRLLDASGDWSRLPGDLLSNKLLSGDLLGSGFPGGLFSSSHCNYTQLPPIFQFKRSISLE